MDSIGVTNQLHFEKLFKRHADLTIRYRRAFNHLQNLKFNGFQSSRLHFEKRMDKEVVLKAICHKITTAQPLLKVTMKASFFDE